MELNTQSKYLRIRSHIGKSVVNNKTVVKIVSINPPYLTYSFLSRRQLTPILILEFKHQFRKIE
jgi:hypothetical protein